MRLQLLIVWSSKTTCKVSSVHLLIAFIHETWGSYILTDGLFLAWRDSVKTTPAWKNTRLLDTRWDTRITFPGENRSERMRKLSIQQAHSCVRMNSISRLVIRQWIRFFQPVCSSFHVLLCFLPHSKLTIYRNQDLRSQSTGGSFAYCFALNLPCFLREKTNTLKCCLNGCQGRTYPVGMVIVVKYMDWD